MTDHLDDGTNRTTAPNTGSPLAWFDSHAGKPEKALIGIGLLFAVTFALYAFNHMSGTHFGLHRPSHVAHYAPNEDNTM